MTDDRVIEFLTSPRGFGVAPRLRNGHTKHPGTMMNSNQRRFEVTDNYNIRWQIKLAVAFQCFSILSMFIGGCVLLFMSDQNENDVYNRSSTGIMNLQYSNATSCTSYIALISSILLIQQLFQQLLGGILISYALGSGLLMLPTIYNMVNTNLSIDRVATSDAASISTIERTVASYCRYCSTISTLIFAICIITMSMVVNSKLSARIHNDNTADYGSNSSNYATTFNPHDEEYTEHDDIDNIRSHDLSNMCDLLLVLGMNIFLFSCTSLIIAVWPTITQDNPSRSTTRNPTLSMTQILNSHDAMTEEDDALQDSLQTPLLLSNEEHETGRNSCIDIHSSIENGTHAIPATTPRCNEDDNCNGTTIGVTALDASPQRPMSETTEMTPPTPTTTKGSGTRRLLQLASSQIVYLYLGCIVMLVRLPFSLALPHFVSTIIAAVASSNFDLAHQQIQFLFVAGTIDAILEFWSSFLFGHADQRVERKLRLDLFAQLIRQEVAFYDMNSSGELSSRLSSDCGEMSRGLTWVFSYSIESVVRISGISTYLIVRCPILGTCAIIITPAVAIINNKYGDWIHGNSKKAQDASANANVAAQETLSNIRTVIAFATESQEYERYENRIERQYQLKIQQLFMSSLYYAAICSFLVNTIVQGTLLWIGSILIERDELTPGILLAFMLYQEQLHQEVMMMLHSYTSLIESSGAGEEVFALIDRQPPQPSTASHITARNRQDVVVDSGDDSSILASSNLLKPQYDNCDHFMFDNITFAYPSRPENVILDGLTLTIPRGQTVALVGTSGGGKTTVINLLQRFYDPCSGQLLKYGNDLRTIDLVAHRKEIGIVTQDPILFQGTIRDNITYGCLIPGQVSNEDVIKAAQLAHAHTFIQSFSDGYDTLIGERGVQLSGGQKQRIAIARALIVQPSLLLLDEATSSLDTESEIAVQTALDELLSSNENQSGDKSITTVVIAHRLRTVQNANKIVVLQKGRVVEEGTHHELLLAPLGIYRQMVELSSSSGLLPG